MWAKYIGIEVPEDDNSHLLDNFILNSSGSLHGDKDAKQRESEGVEM